MIELSIDLRRLESTIAEIASTAENTKKALRSTIGKMSNWLRVRAGRAIRAETKLKHEHLKSRLKKIKIKITSNGVNGGVWVGLNNIDLSRLRPEQNTSGVTTKNPNKSYKGAFMGAKPGMKSRKLNNGVFIRKGRGRLPIQRLGREIETEANKALEANVFDGFEAQFYRTFEHELRWRSQR